jgi:hypothetical protein
VATAAITDHGATPEGVPPGDAGLATSVDPIVWVALGMLSLMTLGGSVALAREHR